ncbi:TonB-dependent receptor [Flavobacterium aquatile]|uniref:TonB-dependent receptor n=1 Tax=Flavobacterium aquatile LMG 4008 = ATCC 11947 TaxID=1453498 RepID=A0A095U1N2_9FLAO|nr:TonB-dependent receptor [Flavobacterium aquatile]KGD68498.1 TonB-dependent receptor [Flavobacterium aquatile LMG 4008 = ATCC 11947]OXA68572.1 TonB-dependent receptor [Flavobacterium aquatile] [Flavobacterium aquatile LMG 4008 = ATCC 11947]GEC79453.1 TonB-dependent receptor [Flavobacterium aquatile]
MKTILTLLIALISTLGFSQNKISGKVVDEKNNPIAGANIFIDGTYDGASSNENGEFTFTTSEKGTKILVISFLSNETLKTSIDIENYQNKTFKLKESMNSLDVVVINAGTFEAGDKSKNTVLKPLDIVTTAGSNGDIVSALQTLPGTQTVGESGRLFVRGGESDETQTYVDGIRVAQPFGSTTQNLPTRGRFSPFLFSGISFSTGGYSAEYGEALSSVLLLNTTDMATENKTDISFMTVGLGLANTQKWKKSSLTFNTAYIDLAPYQVAIPQNVDWNKAFQSLSGEVVYRYELERGLFKLYAAFDASRFDLNQESINSVAKTRVDLKNNNLYVNASYKGNFGSNWQLTTGLSYGLGNNKIGLDNQRIDNTEHASHLKLKLRKSLSDRVKLSFGADYFITKFDEKYTFITDKTGYNSNIAAAFTEADIFFSKKLAMKVGVRAVNNDLLDETSISPRTSIAYKVSKSSQFSFAYGEFEQAPRQDYLKFNSDFTNERASHYILNYQYNKGKRTFRTEVYFKDYKDLVKYDTQVAQYDSNYNNNGFGFAKGLDVFWRDNQSVKNLEYWISYSYIDTKRDYKNYEAEVTPSFVAKNNFSIVTKYWIDDWKSSVGLSYSFNSGRPYDDPNEMDFMNGKTKNYNNVSMSWAYLLSQQKILFISISNILGTENVFGYDYANSPDSNGVFQRKAIIPTADRFFFVGFFWTISENKKDNQLNNL